MKYLNLKNTIQNKLQNFKNTYFKSITKKYLEKEFQNM